MSKNFRVKCVEILKRIVGDFTGIFSLRPNYDSVELGLLHNHVLAQCTCTTCTCTMYMHYMIVLWLQDGDLGATNFS